MEEQRTFETEELFRSSLADELQPLASRAINHGYNVCCRRGCNPVRWFIVEKDQRVCAVQLNLLFGYSVYFFAESKHHTWSKIPIMDSDNDPGMDFLEALRLGTRESFTLVNGEVVNSASTVLYGWKTYPELTFNMVRLIETK